MNATDEHGAFPDWKLERFLLAELDPEETGRIRRALILDRTLRERLDALQRSSRDILARYPAPMMAAGIRRRLEDAAPDRRRSARRPRRPGLRSISAVSLAAAAVALLMLWSPPGERIVEGPVTAVDTRSKGFDPQLLVFRRTGDGSEQLASGAVARKRDRILLRYVAAGRPYGAILSIDGRGAVTRHAPLAGSRPLPLRQDGAVSLDFSYELDDAPRWETFYLVTSVSSFDVEDVLAAARIAAARPRAAAGDSLPLPPGLAQTIFTLEKETSRE
jgi:hypothetical protein